MTPQAEQFRRWFRGAILTLPILVMAIITVKLFQLPSLEVPKLVTSSHSHCTINDSFYQYSGRERILVTSCGNFSQAAEAKNDTGQVTFTPNQNAIWAGLTKGKVVDITASSFDDSHLDYFAPRLQTVVPTQKG